MKKSLIVGLVALILGSYSYAASECPKTDDRAAAVCQLVVEEQHKTAELHQVYNKLACEVEQTIKDKKEGGECIECDASDNHVSAQDRLIESQNSWEKTKDNFCHMRYKLIYPGADASITEINCRVQYINKRIMELTEELGILGGEHKECRSVQDSASNKSLKDAP